MNIPKLKKINLQPNFPLFLFLILFSFGAYSQALAGGDSLDKKIRALKSENSLLETELKLASKGTSYVILDLRTESDSVPARISLKNKGVVLREFDAGKIRRRETKGLVIEPIPLVRKMAFFPPKRKEIKPYKPEDGTDLMYDLDFLELKDVPSNYTLLFGNGLLVSIKGQAKGLIPKFIQLIRSILVHIRYSMTIVWNYLWRNEFTIIEIMMDKEEAQAFYWSLDEGMNILIVDRNSYNPI